MNVCNYRHLQRYYADYPGCHNNRNIELMTNLGTTTSNQPTINLSWNCHIPELLPGKDSINKRSYSRLQIC